MSWEQHPYLSSAIQLDYLYDATSEPTLLRDPDIPDFGALDGYIEPS